jgi:hypothetical protein
VHIDLDRILWRTRGHSWDYCFVLCPRQPVIDTWYDFHVEVFSGTTAGVHPVVSGGVLQLAHGGEIPFFATAFQDSALRDEAGRPIAHYLVWFPSLDEGALHSNINPEWGFRVVEAFGPHWPAAHASMESAVARQFAAIQDHTIEVVPVEGHAIYVPTTQRVIEKKTLEQPQRLLSNKTTLLLSLLVALVVIMVLICRTTSIFAVLNLPFHTRIFSEN